MKQLQEIDYVILNTETRLPLAFKNGDIVLYGDRYEAERECEEDEIVIPCTQLSSHFQQIILNQINK